MVADHSYLVTFRLKGTIPENVLDELRRERDSLRARAATPDEWADFDRREFLKIESILDTTDNSQAHLANEEIAQLLMQSLQWLRRERKWHIHAATIMPNHVHLLTRNLAGHNDHLNADLGDLKSYTARRANRILGRGGSFWARENFDHWYRHDRKLDAARDYIQNNPVKAGLVRNADEWPWTIIDQSSG